MRGLLAPPSVIFAACAFATPIDFTGRGVFNGTDFVFDSGDASPGAKLCNVGEPCNLDLSLSAGGSSDISSVTGTYRGVTWGVFPQLLFATLQVSRQASFGLDAEPGSRLNVPAAVSGTITGPDLQLAFVMNRARSNATVVFAGPLEFEGMLSAIPADPAPEPAAWGLLSAGLLALAGWRRRSAVH